MSNSIAVRNLFNFGRSLPAPFNVGPKKLRISTKFGASNEATLIAGVIKGINAVCACKNATGVGAVGIQNGKNIAEYKSSVDDQYHLVIYDPLTGALNASVYSKDTALMQSYVVNDKNRDGAAIIMAMFPTLVKETEFSETFNKYYEEYVKGLSDVDKARELMAILCENVYRRVQNDTILEHIAADIDAGGTLLPIAKVQLEAGTYEPQDVMVGEFTIFAEKKGNTILTQAKKIMDVEALPGKYSFAKRKYSKAEKALIPQLPNWYIVPQQVIDICSHAQKTTGKAMQMRNFLLRGPAGTGKTMAAQAIAAGLNLPYMKYTCSANTEIFDFTGQIFPETEKMTAKDPTIQKELDELVAMGGINYENVAKLMNLPDLEEIEWNAEGVYAQLAGEEKQGATTQECMVLIMGLVTEKVQALCKAVETGDGSSQSFRYVETDFLKALKHGYLIEIQEPSLILQPGVLVGLNSLLEQGGTVTLPTGEVISRHPDTVVVITTNVNYEGCRDFNQSTIDRMNLVLDMEAPKPELMLQRALSVTGETDEYMVGKMVEVTNNMEIFCREHNILDGCVGMRSLIDWIRSMQVTGDVYHSALYTIISKATSDITSQKWIKEMVLDPAMSALYRTRAA